MTDKFEARKKNRDDLAKTLDGRQIGEEITEGEAEDAENAGLLVVFGGSDDSVEFRGLFDDEAGAYDGGSIRIFRDGIPDEISNPCEDECAYWRRALNGVERRALRIDALWCPENITGNPSWMYKTSAPHATFCIYEDNDLYCIGLVICAADIPERNTGGGE